MFNFGEFSELPNMADLIGGSEENLFQQDINTIMEKNKVLNYLAKIEFEVGAMGFSSSSMQIISFYEQCKKNKGVTQFNTNPVIQFIKQEIKTNFTLRQYLNQRIFDLIDEEMRSELEKIFNNDKLYTDIQTQNNTFVAQKEQKKRQVQKLMSEKGMTQAQAEKAVTEQNVQREVNSFFSNLNQMCFGTEGTPVTTGEEWTTIEEYPSFTVKIKKPVSQHTHNTNKNTEVDLNDDNNTNEGNTGFWGN